MKGCQTILDPAFSRWRFWPRDKKYQWRRRRLQTLVISKLDWTMIHFKVEWSLLKLWDWLNKQCQGCECWTKARKWDFLETLYPVNFWHHRPHVAKLPRTHLRCSNGICPTPPDVLARHCSFRLPLVLVNASWLGWAELCFLWRSQKLGLFVDYPKSREIFLPQYPYADWKMMRIVWANDIVIGNALNKVHCTSLPEWIFKVKGKRNPFKTYSYT